MHQTKLLTVTTVSLWIVNVVIAVAEALGLPHLDDFDSGQRLLVGIMVVSTFAWILRRAGIEYRIGYRQGHDDRDDRDD